MSTLDLRKKMVLDLKKSKGIEGQKAAVVLVMDHSGSMDYLYSSGQVQRLVERILPVALAFDDDGAIDVYRFDDGFKKIKQTANVNNINGFVNNYIYERNNMGGTKYAGPINQIVQDFTSNLQRLNIGSNQPVEKKGFFNKVFGGSSNTSNEEVTQSVQPVYVIFVTDGDNSDKEQTERAIIEAAKHGIFFQFVGIGNASKNFLEKLDNLPGRYIDNANFFNSADIERESDEVLYGKLMGEFPQWLTEAKTKKLLA